jgi:hypothetical protein
MTLDELREVVPFPKWRDVLKFGQDRPAWAGESHLRRFAGFHGDELTDDEFVWFKERGFIPVIGVGELGRHAIVVPIVYVSSDHCFHTTPTERAERIMTGDVGLLPGRIAGHSTTRHPGSARLLHVSITEQDAKAWATRPDLLNRTGEWGEWTILRIDLAAAGLRLFRDPQSATGYIVDAERVPSKFLRVHSRLTIEE